MTKQQQFNVSPISFYSTPPHSCSYLPDEQATTVFVDPSVPVKAELYTTLSQHGFRRSGQHIYRPQCQACRQCIPVRINVSNFSFSKSQQRVLRNNADLDIKTRTGTFTEEYYQLYQKYIALRHSDGDMFPASREQYEKFLLSPWSETYFIEFRLQSRLLSVAVVDLLNDGYSAVYTFFDPSQDKRSLGKLAILQEIIALKEQKHPYLYLGYYIKSCQKMNYKTQYRPMEYLVNNRWIQLR